jgi:hypothetical protein
MITRAITKKAMDGVRLDCTHIEKKDGVRAMHTQRRRV